MGTITASWSRRLRAAAVVVLLGTSAGAWAGGSAVRASRVEGSPLEETITTLTSSANPATVGDSVTFTAEVISINGRTPGGTVTFFEDAIPVVTVGLVEGIARLTTTFPSARGYPITATYNGSELFAPSSDDLTQAVLLIATEITLESSENPSVIGQPVTFTATVTTTSGVAVTEGEVSFRVDVGVPVFVAVVAGQASFTLPTLTIGTHTVQATYHATQRHAASEAFLDQVVGELPPTTSTSTTSTSTTTPPATTTTTPATTTPPPVTTTVPTITTTTTVAERAPTQLEQSSSPNPSVVGQPVTFTATITPVGGAGLATPLGFARRSLAPQQAAPPEGTLTVSDDGTVLAVVPVEGGQASLTISSLSAGSHTITASFSGTATLAPSSATIVQQVNTATTATLPTTR